MTGCLLLHQRRRPGLASMTTSLSPARLHNAPLCRRAISHREAFPRQSVRRDSICNCFGVQLESKEVQVGDIVTRLMIALIQCNTCSPAKHHRLFLRLIILGPSEQATTRDTNIEEWTVVGSAIERCGSEVLLCCGIVVFEESLDFSTAGWPADIKSTAIAIVDGIDVVRRSNLRLPQR